MKNLIILGALLISSLLQASVVGISTHPMNEEGRVLSAEMTGYTSQRNEMGAGLRYTQGIDQDKILDLTVAGAQESRGLTMGGGVDYEILHEDVSQPRLSVKPYLQYQKFNDETSNLLGAAPTMRKGFSANGYEFFPYLAVPSGMKIDSASDSFVYYASLALGASMPFPGSGTDKILLSVEGNKDMGSTSDYLGCLVSWVWK